MPEERVAAEVDGYEIWPEAWSALLVWLDLSTQWRPPIVIRSGDHDRVIWTGLDYAAVEVVMRRRDAGDGVWEAVCEMEQTALLILNERSD